MALNKANLIAEVAARTGRSTSEVTNEMVREVLIDLTIDLEGWFLKATASTLAGTAEYSLRSFPEQFKDVAVVKINDKAPLKRIPSFKHYQLMIAEETSADWEEPEAFIAHNDVLYLHPTPKAASTITLYALKIEINQDDIDLPDYYEPALIQGLCFVLYQSKSQGHLAQAISHRDSYANHKYKISTMELERKSAGVVQPDII